MNSSCTTVHFERSLIIIITKIITNLINYRTTGVGLQRHDPHLQRLRQRGVHGRAFCRATQAACDRTAFSQKAIPTFWNKFYLVCNDTILTSGGSARGGYLEARTAARNKQHAAEQLFTKKLYQRLGIFIANTVVVVGVVVGSQNSYGSCCMHLVAKQKKRKMQSLVQSTLLCLTKIRNNDPTKATC